MKLDAELLAGAARSGSARTGSARRGAVAVDVGGTTLKAVAICDDGTVVASATIPTPSDGEAVLQHLRALLQGLVRELAEAGVAARRIGIATPGLVDNEAGVVEYAANLGWHGVALRADLEELLGIPVHVDHDARAGVLAESVVAPAGLAADLLFVPIGTGIAAAWFASKRVTRGSTGAVGEFGHVPVVPGGEACTCGALGCVEAYASATSLLKRYRRLGGSASDAAEIVAQISTDHRARGVWDDAIAALSGGLTALVALLDPSVVVLGGGLSLAGDALLVPLRRRLTAQLPWRVVPPLVVSPFGARSVLIGAALLGDGRPADDRESMVTSLVATLRSRAQAVA